MESESLLPRSCFNKQWITMYSDICIMCVQYAAITAKSINVALGEHRSRGSTVARVLERKILCALYKTSWSFVTAVTRHVYRDYNRKIWNQPENVYKNYAIFIVNVPLQLVRNRYTAWTVLAFGIRRSYIRSPEKFLFIRK